MKKVISGKVYDTGTAKELGFDCGGDGLTRWAETLYQKRTGEFFLHGEGGPMTKYGVSIGDNEWRGSDKIIPLSPAKAREWGEKHLSGEAYEAAFGLPDEDAEDAVLYAKIPAQLMARLKARAMDDGTSLTETVTKILKEHL